MKSNTKLILTAIAFVVLSSTLFAQGLNNKLDINGNNTTGGNFLGATNNQPLNFRTNNTQRMKLNQNINYPINGYFTGNKNGYFLLGADGNLGTGGTLYQTKGAFSLLHLNGPGSFVQEAGYRPWMQTGVTFTSSSDLMYVGHLSRASDQTDAVITWSDNSGNSGPGPDNLRFIFTESEGNTTNAANPNSTYGREVMRATGYGNVGIGPMFGFTNTNQPQSTLHQHQENALSTWYQITNQFLGGGSSSNSAPTTILPSDGLRLGILGSTSANQNGIGMLYNQENKPLLFSSNANTTTVTTTNTLERIRIMAYNTPTELNSGGYGVYSPDPMSIPSNQNISRVSISHDPSNPVTRPVSLLHLGYNTGENSFTGSGTDGWRNWMDIGMFVSNGTDNVYLGLKNESTSMNDRQDAVLSWGDNQISAIPTGNGPDNLRFIFTSTDAPTAGGSSPANTNKGREVARMTPQGQMGVGDFSPGSANAPATPNYIDATLDVDGDLNIRKVDKSTSLTQVLVRDPADHGKVYYRDDLIGATGHWT